MLNGLHPWYRELYDFQKGLCWLCGELMIPLYGKAKAMPHRATFDHVIPKSRGGTNAKSNLKLAHKVCNERRGAPYMGPSANVIYRGFPVTWVIRPLQRVEDKAWVMTAQHVKGSVTGIGDGVTVREMDGDLLSNPDHTHTHEFGCRTCEDCIAWSKQATQII